MNALTAKNPVTLDLELDTFQRGLIFIRQLTSSASSLHPFNKTVALVKERRETASLRDFLFTHK
jgi:hypothetical protein